MCETRDHAQSSYRRCSLKLDVGVTLGNEGFDVMAYLLEYKRNLKGGLKRTTSIHQAREMYGSDGKGEVLLVTMR